MLFQPAVQFPVLVNGQRMNAFVTEEIDDPVETIFRVGFSDGFMDEFIIEDDGQVYGSGIAAIPYARSIRIDIGHVVGLDPGRFYYNFTERIDNMPVNVWVIEGDNALNELIFKVYYNEFYRFALKRSANKWVITDRPLHSKEPNEQVAKRTGYLLDALLDFPVFSNNQQTA